MFLCSRTSVITTAVPAGTLLLLSILVVATRSKVMYCCMPVCVCVEGGLLVTHSPMLLVLIVNWYQVVNRISRHLQISSCCPYSSSRSSLQRRPQKGGSYVCERNPFNEPLSYGGRSGWRFYLCNYWLLCPTTCKSGQKKCPCTSVVTERIALKLECTGMLHMFAVGWRYY